MPTAILVGWLGCQEKHLGPYKRLYEDLGLDVLTIIAEPRCIVEAALRSDPVEFPSGFPTVERQKGHLRMQDLACQLLAEVQENHNSPLLFHVFSNGGCFLWEAVRKVLDLRKSENSSSLVQIMLRKIERRIRGVVFDSCPCWFGNGSNLRAALEYCTPEEQRAIEEEFGLTTYRHNDGTQRSDDYFAYLQNDRLDVPQLYLCSKDDPLCDYEKVLQLVGDRRSRQTFPVKVHVWRESRHCNHLRKHPQTYREAVGSFTWRALHQSRL